MPILLHLDASPRGDRSITRRLTHDFAIAWKHVHPDGKIIYRDLGRNPVPLVTETFIAAVYTPPAERPPELCAALAVSDQLISELETAAEYVFGVPMYNFTVPAGFKAYIDQVVLPGRTYTTDESGFKRGLLHGKKATVITSEQREKSRMIGSARRAARRSAPTAGYTPAWADPKFLSQVTNPKAFVSAGKLLNRRQSKNLI
jgi:FMN-dependent NADH-azoreductase